MKNCISVLWAIVMKTKVDLLNDFKDYFLENSTYAGVRNDSSSRPCYVVTDYELDYLIVSFLKQELETSDED